MICTAEELLATQRQTPSGYQPAKPLAAPGMTWWNRLRGAWFVLCGRAAAVRWY